MNVRRRPEQLSAVPLAVRWLEDVMRIERETFPRPWSRGTFGREIVEPQSRFSCLLLRGRCIGYGGYWQVLEEMHISNIAIDAAFRRQGYGAWLLAALLREAVADGLTASTLEVREHNLHAQALYERFGFVEGGRRRGYYPEEGEDALIMWNLDIPALVAAFPPDFGVSDTADADVDPEPDPRADP